LVEAKEHLTANGLLTAEGPLDAQTLAKALATLASNSTPKLSANLQKSILSLSKVASKIASHCNGCKRTASLPDLITESKQTLQIELLEINGKIDELGKKVADKIEESTKSLVEVASTVDANFSKALNNPGHQHPRGSSPNATYTYRDALIGNPTHDSGGRRKQFSEEEISTATDRKERQVLISLDENQLTTHSNETLLEKAEHAISLILEPPPPVDVNIVQVSKIRKNAVIINLDTKEAARWLKRPEVSASFTASFLTGSTIKRRQFPLLAPRIPLTFDPGNPVHIGEVEEANLLNTDSIAKARWIKPAYRRSLGQKTAHATFLFNDAESANLCIKDGMYVCGVKIFPSRLKQEPSQCMKCRRWGHFASDCNASKDTCGTCGGEHRSSDCSESEKRYCVSCKTNAHASWDRNCPEFTRRCDWYDEKNPDNTLKFFPTDDAWTQEVRPNKFPFAERFPAKFAVNSIPPPNRNGRDLPTRPIAKKTKRAKSKSKSKTIAGQPTLEGYNFTSSQSQTRAASVNSEEEEGEVFHTMNQFDLEDSTSACPSIC
jgi:hypothetical protein